MTSPAEETRNDAAASSAAATSNNDTGNGSSLEEEPIPRPQRKSTLAKYTPRHPTASNPAKFGKAEPKRDILIFLSIISVIFLISWEMQDVGKPETDPKKRSPLTQLKQMKKQIAKQFDKPTINKVERWDDCDLFVTKSSISSNVGLGIFAGKNYTKGDVIVSLQYMCNFS